MPATVTVPALKPLTYQGRSYVRGELVNALPVDAAVMARRGEVSLSKGAIVAPAPQRDRRDMEAEQRASTPGRRRRNYRRADMQAEPTE